MIRAAPDAAATNFPGLLFRSMLPTLAAFLLCLFAPPAGAVAVAGVAGLAACFVRRRSADYDPGMPEKRLFFTGAFFVLIWCLAAAAHWSLPTRAFAGLAALLLIYPMHRACRSAAFDEGGIWWGLAGACVAAAIAAAAALATSGPFLSPDARWWGNIAFALGVTTLAGLDYCAGRTGRLALLAAAVVGMMAGLVAGSWGAWLALPIVFTIWFLQLPGRLSRRFRWASLLAILIGVEIILLLDGTGTLARFRWLVLQANVWWHSGGQAGLFGIVLHDWSVALAAFAADPLVGAGNAGRIADLNQYVLTLRGSGLVGGLALALLIGVPAHAFARAGRHRNPAVQRIGRAGLLLVTTYGMIGLLQPVFAADRMLVFYAVAVTVLYAALCQPRAAAVA
ncbi:MAG TPA: hypothetical protein VFK45_02295 [Gammaproteobacteria bacterium]|nr:hypothetical protein [Gammaproteobacteria bacterium]